MPDFKRINTCIAKCKRAENEVNKAISETIHPGMRVTWEHGGHVQGGEVVRFGCLSGADTDVFVRNDSTGKTVKLGLYRLHGIETH